MRFPLPPFSLLARGERRQGAVPRMGHSFARRRNGPLLERRSGTIQFLVAWMTLLQFDLFLLFQRVSVDHATRHPFAAREAGYGLRYPVPSMTSAED